MNFDELKNIVFENMDFNFYERLLVDIPEKYSRFGEWGKIIWKESIDEGLINTYPKNTVIKELEKRGIFIDYEKTKESENSPIYIITDDFTKDKINNILNVYGYYISKFSIDSEETIYQIEPKNSKEINIDKSNFYHITFKSHLESIKRIGLVPKKSKTTFYHEGNRIYLIKTEIPEMFLNNFKKQLVQNKLSHLKQYCSEEKYKRIEKNYSLDNIVVLSVNVENIKIYSDPMFENDEYVQACYTLQNISPENIKETNY